jgi:D-alanine-D-alanine ligase
MNVAVVQNRTVTGVINVFGRPCPEKYGAKTLQDVVDALLENGHTVLLCEGDKTLLARLENFMPSNPEGRPGGLVFNMAYGIQGDCRYTHIPAMLEMAGVPYTGSGPMGHTLALDKVLTKQLLSAARIPTPNYCVMRSRRDNSARLRFPVVVKPRHESTSFGLRLVHDQNELGDAVDSVVSQYQQDALVEEYVDGREFCVALLGNENLEIFPIVEQDFGDRESRLLTREDKSHKVAVEAQKVCPAPVDASVVANLLTISAATFHACHCKDYARVDIRVDRQGRTYVLEINSMASLSMRGSYVLAACTAGYTFTGLVNRILDVTHLRYFGVPAPRDFSEAGAYRVSTTA